MPSSRSKHLESTLRTLNFHDALKAFDLVVEVMSSQNGYSRYSGVDFFEHPVDVTQELINFGICRSHTLELPHRVTDQEILTASLLHDLVEDVPEYDLAFILKHFGPNVCHMVDLVTKKESLNYRDPIIHQSYLDEISKHYGAALLKTCDRINNFGTLTGASLDKKVRYAIETRDQFIPFFKKCRKLYPRYQNIFFKAKSQLEPFIHEYLEHEKEINSLKAEIERLKNRTE